MVYHVVLSCKMGGIQTPTDLIYEDKGSKLHQSKWGPDDEAHDELVEL